MRHTLFVITPSSSRSEESQRRASTCGTCTCRARHFRLRLRTDATRLSHLHEQLLVRAARLLHFARRFHFHLRHCKGHLDLQHSTITYNYLLLQTTRMLSVLVLVLPVAYIFHIFCCAPFDKMRVAFFAEPRTRQTAPTTVTKKRD